jgi:hypothetical protein
MKLLALALLAIVPAVPAESNSRAVAKRFIGTWRLVSIVNDLRPADPNDPPTGIIMYDATGLMAVQIVRNAKRPAFANGASQASIEEKAAAFGTYTAYYGPFSVDPVAGTVTHHMEGSTTPGQIGHDNVRYYEFKGNRLILSPVEDGKGGRLAREKTTRHLTWERIPPK